MFFYARGIHARSHKDHDSVMELEVESQAVDLYRYFRLARLFLNFIDKIPAQLTDDLPRVVRPFEEFDFHVFEDRIDDLVHGYLPHIVVFSTSSQASSSLSPSFRFFLSAANSA